MTTAKELYNKIDPYVVARIRSILTSTSSATSSTGIDSNALTAVRDAAILTIGNTSALNAERSLVTSGAITSTDGGANSNYVISLATPGTLSATSANDSTTNHTHAITASSNPGAAAALLKSASDGSLTLTTAYVGNGTVSAPSLAFANSTGTGIYRQAADSLSITTAGAERLRINATGQLSVNGAPLTGYATTIRPATSQTGALTIEGTWVDAVNPVNTSAIFQMAATTTARFMRLVPSIEPTGAITNFISVDNSLRFQNSSQAVTNVRLNQGQFLGQSTYTGAITSLSVFFASNSTLGGATVTNQYGYYASNLTGATNNYAFFAAGTTPSYFGGNVVMASDAEVDGVLDVLTSVKTPIVTTTSGDLTLSPADDVILDPASNLVKATSGVSLQSDNYVSQTTGWRVTYGGEADFRYMFVDEMHAKSFIADLEQALAGGQIISKSVAVLYSTFTAPAAGGTATLTVRDLPSATGMAVFVNGDFVRIRKFSRASGSLSISDCWGTVVLDTTYGTSGYDSATKTQRYTFTRSASPNAGAMTTGTTVAPDTLILDYGTSGNGYYEVNAIDGAYGANSPYSQIVTWSGHPRTQTVRARLGNLYGIWSVSGEYGLYAGGGVTDNDSYLRISSSTVRLNNVPLQLYSSGTQKVNIDANGTDVWIGVNSGDKRLTWNGTTLTVTGQIVVQSGSSGYANITDKPTSLSGINSTEGTKLAGIEAGATVGATWGTNLNSIPTRFGNAPSTAGLYLTATHLGYYNGSAWKAWIASSGEFYFGGSSGAHLEWDGTKLRGLGSDGTTEQWYASSTDGKLYAGAGAVWLDSAGLNFNVPTVGGDYIRFINSGSKVGDIAFLRASGPTPGANDGMVFTNGQSTKFRFVGATLTEFDHNVSVTGNIAVTGTVDGVDIAAFKSAYDSHNHNSAYLALSGGTLTGTLTARSILTSTGDTYDIGSSTAYFNRIYVRNLHTDTIVGTPSYAHHHDSDYVNVTGDTMTGQLTMNFDNFQMIVLNRTANANVDNTFFIGVSYITGITDDFAFFGKSDGLRVFNDSTVKIGTNTVWHQGNDGAGSGLDADTVDGLQASAFSLTSHNHTGVYVPVARTIGTGSGLTGGGDLGGDLILSHADTSTALSITNTGGNVVQTLTFDTFGHVTAHTSTNLDTRYALITDLSNYVPTTRTVTAGTGLTGGGALSANITISHADTSSQANVTGSGTTFIYGMTFDTFGHVQTVTTSDVATALDSRYVNTTGDIMTGNLYIDADQSPSGLGTFGIITQTSNSQGWQMSARANDFAITSQQNDFYLQKYDGSSLIPAFIIDWSTLAITVGGAMTAVANTDADNTFGRAILGYAAGTDSATFAHFDHNTSTNRALSQSAAGATVLNAASGQDISLSINNVATYSVTADRMNPRSSIVVDLGDYNRKLRTIHAAELAVQTLIAQDVIATIGGQIIVAPTSQLIADISSSGTVGGSDALYTNLTSYWPLDEVGGTRSDSKSTNHLVDRNTVTSTTGKISVAAVFDKANSERLNIGDNTALSVGDINFYMSCWIYPTLDDASTMTIASKGAASGDRAWALQINWAGATNRVEFTVWNSSNASTMVPSGTITPNTWYFVEAWHDAGSNIIGVAVNRTEVTTAHTTGVKDDTGNFTIGALSSSNHYTGRIDEFGFWKNYLPDATRRNFLYNSGAGRSYTDVFNYGAGAFTMDLKHNSFGIGEFLYMSAAPGGVQQIEVFKITSAPTTITGGYRYSAERNLDGSGANNWYAGDSVVSLGGSIGEGYINLTATSTVHGHFGPTIAHYVRRGTGTWNNVAPVVVSGNLRSFVDYSADEFGHAAGNDLLLTPAGGFKGYTIDTVNGMRTFNVDISLFEAETQFLSIGTESGVDIEINSTVNNDNRSISFNDTGNQRSYIKGYLHSGAANTLYMSTVATSGLESWLRLESYAPTGQRSQMSMTTWQNGVQGSMILLDYSAAGATSITAQASEISFSSQKVGVDAVNISGFQVGATVSTTARAAPNVRMGLVSPNDEPTILLERTASDQWQIQNAGTFTISKVGTGTMLTLNSAGTAALNLDLDLNANDIVDVSTLTFTGTPQGAVQFGLNNYYIGTISNVDPLFNFDANDYLYYSRLTNMLSLVIGGTGRLQIDSVGNYGLNGASYGGAAGVIFIANRTNGPSSNPVGGGILFVEAGALRYRGSSGTVTTIAAA